MLQLSHIDIFHHNRTTVGNFFPIQQLDQCRLSRSGRSDNIYKFSIINGKIDIPQSMYTILIFLRYVFHYDHNITPDFS